MSATQIRVGLWGLGSHAQRNLLRAFRESSNARLVAIHTRDRAVLAAVAEATNAVPYVEAADLLVAPEVDVIYIATPSGTHFDYAAAAIAAGKHVWCEKPFTDTFQRTAELVAAASSAGLVALETDMFLHHPQFLRLRAIVDSGEIGSILSLTGRFGFPHRPTGDFRYSKKLGGGASLDAGFYPLAAAVTLLDSPLHVGGSRLQSADGFQVDTDGAALLLNERQAAFLDWGFGRSYRSEIDVWCEGATVSINRAFAKPPDLETSVIIRHQTGDVEEVRIPAANHFALMLDHFADVTAGAPVAESMPVLERARLLAAIRDAAGPSEGRLSVVDPSSERDQ